MWKMKDRLRNLMDDKHLKNGQFAEMLGINPAGVSHLLSGRNNPGYELLTKILLRFPDVSADWLLLGAGPMYRLDAEPAAVPSAPQPTPSPVAAPMLDFPAPSEPVEAPRSAESFVQPSKATSGQLVRVVLCYADGSCESFSPNTGR